MDMVCSVPSGLLKDRIVNHTESTLNLGVGVQIVRQIHAGMHGLLQKSFSLHARGNIS